MALTVLSRREEWFSKMETLANSVDDRLFKLLKSLVKIEEDANQASNKSISVEKYKTMYRAGLRAKIDAGSMIIPNLTGDAILDAPIKRLSVLRHIFDSIKVLLH
jgi:hypothetical protein